MRNLLFAFTFATPLLACTGDDDEPSESTPPDDTAPVANPTADTSAPPVEPLTLVGQWELRLYELDNGGTVGSKLVNRVEFNDDDTVTFLGDCNSCSADYTAGVDALNIGSPKCTQRACLETEQAQYFPALQNTWRWSRTESTLRLGYAGGGPGNGGTMEFTLVEP